MTLALLVLACARSPAPPLPDFEPTPLIRDPARGGPPIHPSAAPLPAFQGVSRATATYVGGAACGACHPAEAEVWSRTAHSHAYETLQGRQRAYDPSCIRCHTVGFGHPGGFRSAAQDPGLRGVGCEACHGPGSDHVDAPAAGYGVLPEGPAACVACHTEDNSPDYDWGAYWPQVRHGS
ncbi:MAG: cytochrome c family protein [Alphaproteobacteria bacterium]|nr:cytochrome c family protein [Alphaproteobacteria bacterium]